MNFKVTKEDNIRFLLTNVPENQKDTVLKYLNEFTVEEVSNKEVEELSRVLTTMKVVDDADEVAVAEPPINVDTLLPKDYEKLINFEKTRTTKRSWKRPYKYHR
jgi:hypothetical protein